MPPPRQQFCGPSKFRSLKILSRNLGIEGQPHENDATMPDGLLCSYRTNHIRYFDDSLQVASNPAAAYLTNNINMGTPAVNYLPKAEPNGYSA
jgi:hypothetical protein